MPQIDLITVGKLKNDPLADMFDVYKKRLVWPLTLTEIEAKTNPDQIKRILEKLDPQAALIILDERGKTLSSREFAGQIEGFQNQSIPKLQFVIGGADGLSDDIRTRARLLLSFGKQTWPHMLARVMLMEQIYRAQQILSGHPYHRD